METITNSYAVIFVNSMYILALLLPYLTFWGLVYLFVYFVTNANT